LNATLTQMLEIDSSLVPLELLIKLLFNLTSSFGLVLPEKQEWRSLV